MLLKFDINFVKDWIHFDFRNSNVKANTSSKKPQKWVHINHKICKSKVNYFFSVLNFTNLSSDDRLKVHLFRIIELIKSISLISRMSNIAFFIGWAQMSDLDFGLIRQNISNKKASFQYQGCPLSLKVASCD